jgi:hypothetical protein
MLCFSHTNQGLEVSSEGEGTEIVLNFFKKALRAMYAITGSLPLKSLKMVKKMLYSSMSS